jgi:hypothetical protein
VQREDGSIVTMRPGGNKTRSVRAAFDVCEPRELAVAPGDRLLLQANRDDLINGQIVEVKSVEDTTITLTDGRILPKDYRQFTHGYAVTSHASQGKTVDDVFLVASSRSLAAINRQQFYVSISRGGRQCRIFTDDKELLRDRLKKSAHRTAALELAQLSPLAEAMKREGFAIKTPPPRSPAPAPQSKTARTVRPLRSLRHGHRFARTLQAQIAQLVERFLAWIAQAPPIATKQRVEPQRHHLTP